MTGSLYLLFTLTRFAHPPLNLSSGNDHFSVFGGLFLFLYSS